MSKYRNMLLILFTVILLGSYGLTGCGSTSGHLSYIGADAAKNKAVEASGLDLSDPSMGNAKITCDLREKNGLDYYYVEIICYDEPFIYEIDALSGAMISQKEPAAIGNAGLENEVLEVPGVIIDHNNIEGGISADDARALALSRVPGAAPEDIVEFEVEYDQGAWEYEGKIVYGGMTYEFEIDGYSGAIRDWDSDPAN